MDQCAVDVIHDVHFRQGHHPECPSEIAAAVSVEIVQCIEQLHVRAVADLQQHSFRVRAGGPACRTQQVRDRLVREVVPQR